MAQGQSGRVEGSLAVGIQAGPALSASLSRARRQPPTGVSTQKRDGGDRKFLSISCFQSRILSSLGGSPVLSALHSLGPKRGLVGAGRACRHQNPSWSLKCSSTSAKPQYNPVR